MYIFQDQGPNINKIHKTIPLLDFVLIKSNTDYFKALDFQYYISK
jgi:hypothetical protein